MYWREAQDRLPRTIARWLNVRIESELLWLGVLGIRSKQKTP
jgi:hypothetical protein